MAQHEIRQGRSLYNHVKDERDCAIRADLAIGQRCGAGRGPRVEPAPGGARPGHPGARWRLNRAYRDYAIKRRDQALYELKTYKEVYHKAIAAVDQVFQTGWKDGAECILPGFVRLGGDKFEAVIKLANDYKQQVAANNELRMERDDMRDDMRAAKEKLDHLLTAALVEKQDAIRERDRANQESYEARADRDAAIKQRDDMYEMGLEDHQGAPDDRRGLQRSLPPPVPVIYPPAPSLPTGMITLGAIALWLWLLSCFKPGKAKDVVRGFGMGMLIALAILACAGAP